MALSVCFRAAAVVSGLPQSQCANCVNQVLAHLRRAGIGEGQNVPPVCRRRYGGQDVGLSNIGHINNVVKKQVSLALNNILQPQRQSGCSKHELVSCV